MWEAVETKAKEVRVAEIEKRGGKKGSRKEVRRKGKGEGENTEKTKNNEYKKNSRRIGDMGGGKSSKVRRS